MTHYMSAPYIDGAIPSWCNLIRYYAHFQIPTIITIGLIGDNFERLKNS